METNRSDFELKIVENEDISTKDSLRARILPEKNSTSTSAKKFPKRRKFKISKKYIPESPKYLLMILIFLVVILLVVIVLLFIGNTFFFTLLSNFLMAYFAPCSENITYTISHTHFNTQIDNSHFHSDDFGHLSIFNLQQITTHNSYHQKEIILGEFLNSYEHSSIVQQLLMGVRGFEFDIHYNRPEDRWKVYHIPFIDSKSHCNCLMDCLVDFKAWSSNNSHNIITIMIEPKYIIDVFNPFCLSSDGYIFDNLINEIMSVFDINDIITPQMIKRNYPTLREAIVSDGWPGLNVTRNKFMFLLKLYEENIECRELYDTYNVNFFWKVNGIEYLNDDDAAIFEVDGNNIISNLMKNNFLIRCGSVDKINDLNEKCYGAHLIRTDDPDILIDNFGSKICNVVSNLNCINGEIP